jgi:hypothetical protein
LTSDRVVFEAHCQGFAMRDEKFLNGEPGQPPEIANCDFDSSSLEKPVDLLLSRSFG